LNKNNLKGKLFEKIGRKAMGLRFYIGKTTIATLPNEWWWL